MNTLSTSLDVKDSVPLRQHSDDFDLVGLIRSIARVWKQWLIAVILVALAYTGYAVWQYLQAGEVLVYRKAIEFTFPGVEKNEYPNESRFSLQDIIAPVVVNEVYTANKLDEYGISLDRFRSALTIEPYAPQYFLIIEKYENMLDTRRMKPAEINGVRERMQSELSAVNKGAALVSLHMNQISVPETVVEKVLIQIPEVWARRSIEEKGVLNLNIQLVTSRAIDRNLSDQVDYMQISEYLNQKTMLVDKNIEKLMEHPDAALIVDKESGLRLSDVRHELNDLKRYVIDEIMFPVRSLGLSRNPEMALYYYTDKNNILLGKLALLKSQSSLVKDTLENYASGTQTNRAASGEPNVTIDQQLNSGAIDKIISLSREVKSEEYRQELNRQWLDIEMEYMQVQRAISDNKDLIAALKNAERNSGNSEMRKLYLARMEESLPELLNRLREYLDVSQRIYKKLSEENIGVNDYLYRPLTNSPLISKTEFSVKKHMVILAALLALTTIVVVPVLLIRSMLRSRAEPSYD